ncbi:1-aminocyclopropane-1-carboxylate synthase-like protein 1 [Purpureocillium lavendulum]|uniref:1-aminocyclopropane-1-carboxylate synthase-like protein 1 n=1 Tax=Purpureocillium lavendulum TaxID=1247861 RepID=A0AB34G1N9_9HYPO|nr:1-aminocyclopropane-1-carboxylate synthase-like protein 1 [Purpureocillium lavendulum]
MGAIQELIHQIEGGQLANPVFLGSVATLVALGLIYLWSSRPKPHNLPVVKVTGNNVVETLEEAHQKTFPVQYPKEPFMLSLPGMEMAVLPDSEIETIRGLPETDVSIKKHHYDVFLGEYSYMGTKADEFDSTMRNVLTRNTPAVLASFTAEVEWAVNKMIGPCKDWTAIKPRYAMSRIASIMSGRAFVGLPLSRQEEWVEATVDYTAGVSRAWLILRLIPWPIRFFVAPFLPQVKALKQQRKINEQKLAPVIAEKRSGAKKDKGIPGGDMLEWFISQYSQPPNAQQLGRDQLLATFASIYNLSNALSYIIFDLAALDPHDVELMREEVLQHVPADGRIDKMNLPKLKRLDSFAKESQRLSPPSLVNIPRIVTNPNGLQCSTGQVLPQGTRMTIHAHVINQNPELYPNPTEFQPFRFSKLRETPGNEHKFQHATTGIDNINFGHGIWACPGRFFASAEIKVVLAYILRHYDVTLKPGEPKPKQQHFGLAILPDPTAEVLFKARK